MFVKFGESQLRACMCSFNNSGYRAACRYHNESVSVKYSRGRMRQLGIGKKQIQITARCKAPSEFSAGLMAPAPLATVRTYNLIFAIYEDRARGPPGAVPLSSRRRVPAACIYPHVKSIVGAFYDANFSEPLRITFVFCESRDTG